MMTDLICPFHATLVKDDFACPHAEQIIRRGGTEFACQAASVHANCTQLFGKLKDAALPAFDVEDDLLQVPHGVLAKVQFGGLLGLQRITLDSGVDQHRHITDAGRVGDIAALVNAAITRYSGVNEIPCGDVVEDITGYKLSRRRRR
jgi:hypothetical protein